MKLRSLLLASAAAAALAAGPAHAVTLVSATTAGASTVTDFSGDGLLAFDLDLRDDAPVTLTFSLSAMDLGGTIEFNSVVRNLTGWVQGLQTLRFELSPLTVASAGTVTRFFGGTTQSVGGTGAVALVFTPTEYFDIEIGNAFGTTPGAANWSLSAAGLNPGDTFTVTAVVPEPTTVALMLLGLAGIGAAARRRTRL
jgi:hypothetical protein